MKVKKIFSMSQILLTLLLVFLSLTMIVPLLNILAMSLSSPESSVAMSGIRIIPKDGNLTIPIYIGDYIVNPNKWINNSISNINIETDMGITELSTNDSTKQIVYVTIGKDWFGEDWCNTKEFWWKVGTTEQTVQPGNSFFPLTFPTIFGTSTSSYEKGYEAEGPIMRQFESLLSEFDMAGWTAIQGNRNSINAENVDSSMIGGSIKKGQIGHFILSIAKDLDQKEIVKQVENQQNNFFLTTAELQKMMTKGEVIDVEPDDESKLLRES